VSSTVTGRLARARAEACWAGSPGIWAARHSAATAFLLARRGQRAGLTALAGGTLLVVDGWFDVCTSAPGADQLMAVTAALLVELPLAATAIWFVVTPARGTLTGRPAP
jgi:hypothetical protein